MANSYVTHTGTGAQTLFTFTFPYLSADHVKVSINDVANTAWTLANATTVQFNSAPANGAAIKIYRDTPTSSLLTSFNAGSAIRAADLNNGLKQILYVSDETADFAADTDASAIQSTANTALANSNTAITTANAASATANGLAASISTANSNATTAVNTANAASADATSALSTANAAQSTANAALPKAGGIMTGDISFADAGEGIVFSDSTKVATISNSTSTTSSTTAASSTAVKSAYDLADAALPKTSVSDSTSTTSSTTAASSTAVKAAYDLANAALPKSGGTLTSDLTLNAQSDLRFADSDSSNWVALQAPATVASNVTWTLPDADGSAGTILGTNGSGTLSWVNGRMVHATELASTSGSSVEFTSLPSWVKKLTIILNDVSISGTDNFLVQLSTSSAFVTSGYNSNVWRGASASNAYAQSTAGFLISETVSAAGFYSGVVTVYKIGSGSDVWVSQGFTNVLTGANSGSSSVGRIELGGTCDGIRLDTTGTNTFDAGTVGLIYEG